MRTIFLRLGFGRLGGFTTKLPRTGYVADYPLW
jgi:hypothetical protein